MQDILNDQSVLDMFAIIKKSIFGYPFDINSVHDKEAVYEEMKRHTLIGLLLPVLSESDSKLKKSCYQVLYTNTVICREQARVLNLLQTRGIPSVVIKGSAAAVYYPHPELRMMGDIDLLVLPEDYEKTIQVLEEDGYHYHEWIDPSCRHMELFKNHVEIEVHCHLRDLKSEDNELFVASGIRKRQQKQVGANAFFALPENMNGVVLLAHTRHHIRRGIGLRQIIDWMLYAYTNLDETTWENTFSKEAERFGLKKLALVLTKMCVIYLGLPQTVVPWCVSADNELCKMLMCEIIRVGNFGEGDTSTKRRLARGLSYKMSVRYYFRVLQREGLRHVFFTRHKLLRPFAWIYQGFVFLKASTSEKKQNRDSILKQTQERAILLEKLDI